MKHARTYLSLIALLLLVMVAACATKALTDQQVIRETREGILAVKGLIFDNLKDGFYSADKASTMLDEVEKQERTLNQAVEWLTLGKDITLARSQIGTARSALRTIRRQVEEKK